MNYDNATSLSLLEQLRSGDNSGWQRVLCLYWPLAHYWCRHWGIRNTDTEDVLQEVFRSAAESIATFRHDREGDSFRGWLRVITRHRVLAFYRSRDTHAAAAGGSEVLERLRQIPQPDPPVPDDPGEAAQFSALVHRALIPLRQEFAAKSWQAFWRTAVDDQPSSDVAAELGMSVSAVRMAKSRVLRRLREELGDFVADPLCAPAISRGRRAGKSRVAPATHCLCEL